jgi:ferritin-like metal-binding protein YciE
MAVESLRTHLVEELTDLLDAENQLTKALPKMAASATNRQLKSAFEGHLRQTRGQIARLDKALRQLGERPRRKTCEAMQGLISEGEDVMNKTPEGALRDAVMITAAQKVEHYEMASYGTVRTYAQVLGEPGVARLLEQTLREEKATDTKLTNIAERSVNERAATEWQAQEEQGIVGRAGDWIQDTFGGMGRSGKGQRRAGTAHDRARKSRGRTRSSRGGARRKSGARSRR